MILPSDHLHDTTAGILASHGRKAVLLTWTSIIIPPWDLTARPTDADDETPRLIAQLYLEITLTGEVPPQDKETFIKRPTINRDHLTDDAFQPKFFNVRIEDGQFATPVSLSAAVRLPRLFPGVPDKVWTKCLVFDNSPFPPAPQWKEDAYWGICNPEGTNCWDFKDFVAYFTIRQSRSNWIPPAPV